MMKRWCRGMRLSLLFSLVVLLIFLITSLIMVGMALLGMHLGLLDRLGLRRSLPVVVALLPASAIVGTLVALTFGRIPLKPLQQIIDATRRLAAGDFSARVSFRRPGQFRELRDSFNRMAEELGSLELLRTDFINNFSHEFKTPIVSIKGFAELLREGGLTPEENDEYLDIIIRESSRLSSMATNVLNLSRYENQSILTERTAFPLDEMVRRCVLLLQSAWENKALDMDVELEAITVRGDAEMLSQVWLNLLDNAVKFSPHGGLIAIRLRREGGEAVFSLLDNGPGIPPEELPHVFEKFYRAQGDASVPGNGLGLALAQKIVRLHGGAIACESKPGEGACFTVRLPLDAA